MTVTRYISVARYKLGAHCMYTIFVTRKLPDSWVNTLLLFNKYITQVWLAWRQAEPFWLIADWLGLLLYQVRIGENSISELSAELIPVLENAWQLDLDVLF